MTKGFAPGSSSTPTSSSRPSDPVKRVKRTIIDELKNLDDPRTKRKPDHLLVDSRPLAKVAIAKFFLCPSDRLRQQTKFVVVYSSN
ncbi:hypothetical protein [Moorena sp. SIO3A5]|uniref:hypothetical protein n=1 Tax=Moorena sp. SIO3A5 TaxID=2607822 RepID=UPI0013BAB20D|nr:hypothetical protein [Moorena sp. SIO3A5]NEQ12230.1 hypothetical protein [Moorena sp. SIO4E2]